MPGCIYEFRPQLGGFFIDDQKRQIELNHAGVKSVVPFNSAFAKAIDSYIHVEDKKLPHDYQRLFLRAYENYLLGAPRWIPQHGLV